MTGRSRHGLYSVKDSGPPGAAAVATFLPSASGPLFLSLRQQSLVLAVGGRLDADTAARLHMYLSKFTRAGGPQELVLDLSEVVAVDEDGMAPIIEADETMRLRSASLRLTAHSAAVADFLDEDRRSPGED
jgi:anti-anti-sigma factor